MNKLETGRAGEDEAVNFLKRKRYKILERNFRTKFGEIDIIAKKGKEIIFIEVKTRKTTEFGYPEEAIDKEKQEHIKKVASYYIQKKKVKNPIAFEVLSVLIKGEEKEIKIIPLE